MGSSCIGIFQKLIVNTRSTVLKWLIGKNEVLFVVHEFQNFDSLQTCIESAESADRKNRSSPKLENHFDYIFPLFFLLIH